MCLYTIFLINLSARVNSQKTGNRLESHPFFKQGDREDVNNYRPIFGYHSCGKGICENCLRTIICLFRGARYTMKTSVKFACYLLNCYSFA